MEGAKLWEGLESELEGSLEMHTTGGLMVAETDDELALLHAKQRIEQDAGLETHVLEGEELRSFAPFLAPDLKGATYCPAEGHANPLLAAPLYALRAAQAGAAIRTGAQVQAVQMGERGGFTVRIAPRQHPGLTVGQRCRRLDQRDRSDGRDCSTPCAATGCMST